MACIVFRWRECQEAAGPAKAGSAAATAEIHNLLGRSLSLAQRPAANAKGPAGIAERARAPKTVFRPSQVRRGIETVCAPWITAQNPPCSEPASDPGAIQIDGIERILGAGRQVPAARTEQRRNRISVEIDWRLHHDLQVVLHQRSTASFIGKRKRCESNRAARLLDGQERLRAAKAAQLVKTVDYSGLPENARRSLSERKVASRFPGLLNNQETGGRPGLPPTQFIRTGRRVTT